MLCRKFTDRAKALTNQEKVDDHGEARHKHGSPRFSNFTPIAGHAPNGQPQAVGTNLARLRVNPKPSRPCTSREERSRGHARFNDAAGEIGAPARSLSQFCVAAVAEGFGF
jgi:hypothetical protein